MRLSQVVIPTIDVQFGPEPDQFFPVRGLNINDLTSLVAEHTPSALQLWDMFNNARKELDGDAFTKELAIQLFGAALKEFPDLIFHAITVAADDPEAGPVARKLPLSVQVATLETIFAASIRTEAEVKKLGEMFFALTKVAITITVKMKQLWQDGSGVSAEG